MALLRASRDGFGVVCARFLIFISFHFAAAAAAAIGVRACCPTTSFHVPLPFAKVGAVWFGSGLVLGLRIGGCVWKLVCVRLCAERAPFNSAAMQHSASTRGAPGATNELLEMSGLSGRPPARHGGGRRLFIACKWQRAGPGNSCHVRACTPTLPAHTDWPIVLLGPGPIERSCSIGLACGEPEWRRRWLRGVRKVDKYIAR